MSISSSVLPKQPQNWRQPSHSPVQIRQIASKTTTAKKPPRTVHIDVYCTGSEADEDNDDVDVDDSFSADSISPTTSLSSLDLATASKSHVNHKFLQAQATHKRKSINQRPHVNSFDDNHNNNNDNDDEEIASNSTPQTVFNASQVRLHHSRRNSRQTLPRRIVNQMLQLNQEGIVPFPTQRGQMRQYILDQDNTKDEINVSKMMLFDKHMSGTDDNAPAATRSSVDAAQADTLPTAAPNRRKFNCTHYANADLDVDSSIYPNSSRSTLRDHTWSSMSSAMAGTGGGSGGFDDLESLAATGGFNAVAPLPSNLSTADSFEYENAVDRARIREMEQMWLDSQTGQTSNSDQAGNIGWRSPEKERKFMMQQHKRMGGGRHQTMADLTEGDSERELQGARRRSAVQTPVNKPIEPNRWPGASLDVNRLYRRQNAIEYDQPTTPEEQPLQLQRPAKPQHQIPMSPIRAPSDRRLRLADEPKLLTTRFGQRIEISRKRHFGPAKNPDCPCDHCRLFAAERRHAKQVRARTMSMGDDAMSSALRTSAFWASRHRFG